MKLFCTVLCGVALFAAPIHASERLGFIGTDSGVPNAGNEDVVIYNLTGPVWGCSSPSGIPVCTPVTFENVVLTINGSPLSLADIAPGVSETYTVPGGTFVDGTINSLSFNATIAPTVLTDDLGNLLSADSFISLTGLPTDGSLASITDDVTSIPEPSSSALLGILSFVACARLARRKWSFAKRVARVAPAAPRNTALSKIV